MAKNLTRELMDAALVGEKPAGAEFLRGSFGLNPVALWGLQPLIRSDVLKRLVSTVVRSKALELEYSSPGGLANWMRWRLKKSAADA